VRRAQDKDVKRAEQRRHVSDIRHEVDIRKRGSPFTDFCLQVALADKNKMEPWHTYLQQLRRLDEIDMSLHRVETADMPDENLVGSHSQPLAPTGGWTVWLESV
jgi:hypothetical protein